MLISGMSGYMVQARRYMNFVRDLISIPLGFL